MIFVRVQCAWLSWGGREKTDMVCGDCPDIEIPCVGTFLVFRCGFVDHNLSVCCGEQS